MGLSTADRSAVAPSPCRRCTWRHAGGIGWRSTTPRAGGLIFLGTTAAALESAAANPLALAIQHPANRLAALRATVVCLDAA